MSSSSKPELNRRTLFAGAGAVGALAAVAAIAPAVQKTTEADVKTAKTEATGGYQLTDHVKQYYATARV